MSRVLVTGDYQEGDVAVAPNGQTFATRLQGGGACWNCKMRAGTVMTSDAAVREMVEAGMVQVYREEPEPPFLQGRIVGEGPFSYADAQDLPPKGTYVLIVPDTPENRALLAASDKERDALIAAVRAEALEEAKRFVDNGRFLTDTSMERQWATQVCKGLEALKGTAPQSPWMPIASAPKDGTWCFVTNDPIGNRVPYSYAERATFIPELSGWWNRAVLAADCDCLHEPTHWMPLPVPPTEEAG